MCWLTCHLTWCADLTDCLPSHAVSVVPPLRNISNMAFNAPSAPYLQAVHLCGRGAGQGGEVLLVALPSDVASEVHDPTMADVSIF